MCGTCSSFNNSVGIYSSLDDSQLHQQCANELGLDINDSRKQSVLDACVSDKKGAPKGQQVIGWIEKGGNILTTIAQLFGQQNPQQVDVNGAYPVGYDQPKGLTGGQWAMIIGGIALLGTIGYFAFKKSKQNG